MEVFAAGIQVKVLPFAAVLTLTFNTIELEMLVKEVNTHFAKQRNKNNKWNEDASLWAKFYYNLILSSRMHWISWGGDVPASGPRGWDLWSKISGFVVYLPQYNMDKSRD